MANTDFEKQEQETVEETGKTFTQEEVDAIVQTRLGKEKSKYADYDALKEKASKFDEIEEANKTELEKANERANSLEEKLNQMTKANEIRSIREKVSQETGVPIDLLRADTEDGCNEIAKGILEFKDTKSYPSVKDGGEDVEIPSLTKEDILAVKSEKERLKLIEENIELFK